MQRFATVAALSAVPRAAAREVMDVVEILTMGCPTVVRSARAERDQALPGSVGAAQAQEQGDPEGWEEATALEMMMVAAM